jgi:hypothetical protein
MTLLTLLTGNKVFRSTTQEAVRLASSDACRDKDRSSGKEKGGHKVDVSHLF